MIAASAGSHCEKIGDQIAAPFRHFVERERTRVLDVVASVPRPAASDDTFLRNPLFPGFPVWANAKEG